MQDLPTKTTLLAGVARFLSEEILPHTADRGRAFRVRIAAHLVASVAREIDREERHDAAEMTRLADLLGVAPTVTQGNTARRHDLTQLNAQLADDIQRGEPTLDAAAVHAHLLQTLREKLAVNQPRFDTRMDPETPET